MDRFAPDSGLAGDIAPSPNHGARKGVIAPDSVILHYTGMPTADGALAWLRDPASQVSCHYFVFEDGRIVQLVPEERRAWHAGRSLWAGATDMNSHSIGVEIANGGHDGGLPDFPGAQIEAVSALCADIAARRVIAPQRFLAHSDIAPGRKRDPGERFPWDVLARAGVGHWRDPAPIGGGRFLSRGDHGQPVEALQAMLALYGYGAAVNAMFDAATEDVVAAFQRHFRPARVDGVADASTISTLRDLIAALPAAEA
jgi:N-acetylmuramoyl-L-alanine amidase